MKVLYAASEALPFVASGGLADVAGSLPRAIRNRQVACRVVLPLYSDINPELKNDLHYLTSFTVDLSWRKQYCGVFEKNVNGVVYYLLDNEYYFKRKGLYGFYDDGERFAFFSKAVLEMINHIDFVPDIIHANDWHTALIPVYLNAYYRGSERHQNIRSVFTIHNIQYQGKYGLDTLSDPFGLPDSMRNIFEYDGCVNLMKGAIESADVVTTVSPTYAREILDPWFAHGLDRFLRARSFKLMGILNGIDTDSYNPETDRDIFRNYSAKDISGKDDNKMGLRELVNLPPVDDVPLIGMVTRLVAHKGLDLVKCVFDDIMRLGAQMVILGSGEYLYENFFYDMQRAYPDQCAPLPDLFPTWRERSMPAPICS